MGKFGFFAPIVGSIMILLSLNATSNWSIAADTLSDLGKSGFSSVLFNSGLLMSGAVMMLFSTGLYEFTKGNIIGQIGSILYIASSFIVCALGIATINVQPIHNYLSTSLFVLIPIIMAAFGSHLYQVDMKKYAMLAVIGFIISSGIWLIEGKVNAIKEIVALGALTLWQLPLGIWMARREIIED
jgi:hypothetical membrane protein